MDAHEKAAKASNTRITLEQVAPGVAVVTEVTEAAEEKPTGRKRVDLDDMAADLDNLELAQKLVADWEATIKEIKARIVARLGPDGEGYRNGKAVWVHSPTEKFAVKKFTADNPQIAEQFTHSTVVTKLNEDELARALPELYAQYKVSVLRPVGSRA